MRQPSPPQAIAAWPRLSHALVLLFALLSAGTAQAHPFLQDSWWVVVETNRLVMRVSATLREIAVVQKVPVPTNGLTDLDAIQTALTHHGSYLLKALKLEADGVPLSGEVLDWQLVGDAGASEPADSPLYLERTHAAFDLEFRFGAAGPPREITFGHATLKEHRYAPGVPWDVTYALTVKDAGLKDIAAGIVRIDLPFTLALKMPTNAPSASAPAPPSASMASTTGPPGLALPAMKPTRPDVMAGFKAADPSASFTSYLRLGIHHILTGYDHLLFLAALALAAVRLADFFKLIATFTLAHSLTVTLSALGYVRLPPWFVEPFIAASIVFVAVENLVSPRRAGARSRLALAFGFGLVHGLGFAGGLVDAIGGTGGASLAVAILAFCLGVELGHLMVGLPFWCAIRANRAEFGERSAARVHRAGSVAIAVGGIYFLVAALRQYL